MMILIQARDGKEVDKRYSIMLKCLKMECNQLVIIDIKPMKILRKMLNSSHK